MTKENKYADIVLGFAEEALPETNDPENLASRAGGLPIWLYRPPARPPKAPRCKICLQPQTFLLQIYCPLEADAVGHTNAFHRMLYVAVCKQSSCQKRSDCVSVIRGQLARDNEFYGWDGGSCVEEGDKEECSLCGFWGENKCSGCGLRYCGRVCQMEDWKLGHRECCKEGKSGDDLEAKRQRYRFREAEIVTDSHPTPHSSDLEEEEEEEDQDRAQDERESCEGPEGQVGDGSGGRRRDEGGSVSDSQGREAVHDSEVNGTMQDADEEELPEDLFRGKGKKDAVFERMRRLMRYAPDQVIRYQRGGEVLWGGKHNQCENVESCGHCGGERMFEFQIMPQLVYYLGRAEEGQTIEKIARRLRDDMDWTTIAIYTCESSCGEAGEYVREYAWVQTASDAV